MKKVVFFDRDGTLIEDKIYLNDPNQIVYLPHVFTSLRTLRDQGFEFIVVTNQSGVPRGLVKLKNLWEIHQRMRCEFSRHGIDFLDFLYAPFMTDSDHFLRKPNPGMLFEAKAKFCINMKQSWMVGDRMTDVEAGRRAGTQTILLGNTESPQMSPYAPPVAQANHLWEVTQIITKSQFN